MINQVPKADHSTQNLMIFQPLPDGIRIPVFHPQAHIFYETSHIARKEADTFVSASLITIIGMWCQPKQNLVI